ncbi:hypothetical protein CKO42_04850 [Lamprobacter modestohalophilus]|uniref:Uncharacterized protein n=1 Tax=Lamprobacter modestohalophilus TaxID=1064514 RepID=A0A9X0W7R7_9GAMM|nr:hypothetical protein [Lamprobacter modestohalophilus]
MAGIVTLAARHVDTLAPTKDSRFFARSWASDVGSISAVQSAGWSPAWAQRQRHTIVNAGF